MIDEFNFNRRTRDRVPAELSARYFIKNKSKRYENCTLINLSRTGAAVLFPPNEMLPKDAFVFLEVMVPNSFDQVMIRGELKRVYVKDKMVVGGIKFEKILPEITFHDLI